MTNESKDQPQQSPPGEAVDKRPQIIIDADAKEKGERFMGLPCRWYDAGPKWRCANGHVSTRYLKSEESGNVCLACHGQLWLTFPEDEDAPAPQPAPEVPEGREG